MTEWRNPRDAPFNEDVLVRWGYEVSPDPFQRIGICHWENSRTKLRMRTPDQWAKSEAVGNGLPIIPNFFWLHGGSPRELCIVCGYMKVSVRCGCE